LTEKNTQKCVDSLSINFIPKGRSYNVLTVWNLISLTANFVLNAVWY
jgi:hypothetical protein